MNITQAKTAELEALCQGMRRELIDLLYERQTGHPGGSLSCCEILVTLYFHTMRIDPEHPDSPGRDRLILSKGHAAPMLYLCLAHRGFFPVEELATLRKIDSRLQGHPCAHKTPGVDLSTGPLGLGLSAGVGMAESARLTGSDYDVYVVLGDGEIQEGAVWEAAMTANKLKTGNLIAILDDNGVQLDGTVEEIMPAGSAAQKFEAFGCHTLTADGHSIEDLAAVFEQAKACRSGPVLIDARTVKGKGVPFMEGRSIWHGRPISAEDYTLAKQALGGAQ